MNRRFALLLALAVGGCGNSSNNTARKDFATTPDDLTQSTDDLSTDDALGPDLATGDGAADAATDAASDAAVDAAVDAPPADLAKSDVVVAHDLAPLDLKSSPDLKPSPDLALGDGGADAGGDGGSADAGHTPDLGAAGPQLVVVQVGDGTTTLTANATAISLVKYNLDGTQDKTGGWPVALPTVAAGNNYPLTVSGTSTSEGALSRSSDGKYVVVGGYGTSPGAASVTGSSWAAVPRVVARVDSAGTVDSTTHLGGSVTGGNIRSATTSDGMEFWTGNSSGGIYYAALGATTGTQVLAMPANVRVVNVFGGQLYGDSASGTYQGVYTVGSGLPTMTATATVLNGMPTTTGPAPYGFALLDLDSNVAGLDTLYVAQDLAASSGGGIQKWTFDGTKWTLAVTFSNGLTTGGRGLAVWNAGATRHLYSTSTDSPNSIFEFVDDGVNMNPMVHFIATAASLTTDAGSTAAAFRGLALAPLP